MNLSIAAQQGFPNQMLKLVIQPSQGSVISCLQLLGFLQVPAVPELWFCIVPAGQVVAYLDQLGHLVPESAQQASRLLMTYNDIDAGKLLREFLKAQPLQEVTCLVKHGWFLSVLSKQAIFFHYQPILDLSTRQVVAYECLARANNGEGKHPWNGQQLVDAAQATHLIYAFDEMARRQCLYEIAAFLPHLPPPRNQRFFINVLPNALVQNPRSIEQNLIQMMDLGLKPSQIVFELTEIESVEVTPDLIAVLQFMREWGCSLAVDDWGSDVALRNYCLEIQPDIIKLDRAMITGCGSQPLRQLLLKSLVNAAHDSGIIVLAEGIEVLEDLSFCSEIGVDLAQGFLFAQPELNLRREGIWQPDWKLALVS
ncbi:MAG: EAL domain-containing protein [Synechococcales bacterium]|nr:EAL domain-containing protein [Synechococcales bacterium]